MKVRALALGPTLGDRARRRVYHDRLCGHAGKKAAGPPPLAVDVSRVQRRDIATQLTLDGQIAPLQESTLSTPESGTVSAVYVNEGDAVRAGELLAKLDTFAARGAACRQRGRRRTSQAKVSSSAVQAPISSQQYASAVSQAEQNVQQAQNRVRTAQAALKNAQLVYNSDQALAGQGYVARTQVEQSRAAYVSAAARAQQRANRPCRPPKPR